MKELKFTDYVILDTRFIGLRAEAMQYLDAMLYVARYNYTMGNC